MATTCCNLISSFPDNVSLWFVARWKKAVVSSKGLYKLSTIAGNLKSGFRWASEYDIHFDKSVHSAMKLND